MTLRNLIYVECSTYASNIPSATGVRCALNNGRRTKMWLVEAKTNSHLSDSIIILIGWSISHYPLQNFKKNKTTSSNVNTSENNCGTGERGGCDLNRIRTSSFNKRTKNRKAIDKKYRC